jgi:hypothetical protein
MKLSLFFRSLLVLATCMQSVQAWPTGAGACPEGKAGTDGVPNHQQTTTTTAMLMEGDYMVKIDGQELKPDTPFKIPVGQPVTVELMGVGTAMFKGFLLRLSSSTATVSTLDMLQVDEGDATDTVQVAAMCTSVAGLTHTTNADKTSVMGILQVDEPDDALMLDVTVVRVNGGALSETFYDGFSLVAEPAMEGPSNAEIKQQLDRIESKLDTLLGQCGTAVVTAKGNPDLP